MFRREWHWYDEGKAIPTTRLFVNLKAIKRALACENETCRVNSYCSFQIYMARDEIIKDEVSVALCYGGMPGGLYSGSTIAWSGFFSERTAREL